MFKPNAPWNHQYDYIDALERLRPSIVLSLHSELHRDVAGPTRTISAHEISVLSTNEANKAEVDSTLLGVLQHPLTTVEVFLRSRIHAVRMVYFLDTSNQTAVVDS